MPPFGINPPQPLDFRYPGAFNLNQTPKLPNSFGPPDMSSMLQSGISGLVDPLITGMQKARDLSSSKSIADTLVSLGDSYKPTGSTAAGGTAMPGAVPGAQASATAGSPAGDDTTGTMGGGKLAATNPEVRDNFMNTVKTGGLNNPYGLAAVAAYGQRESGWSSGNINRTWDDLGAPSGGALSWRAGRLRNMQAFVRGAEDPVAAQAQFFIKENPQLIADLNNAKSPEEANQLMADAWRFKGYNKLGSPEYQARLALTRAYANRMGTAAPAPQPAPTASFAPQVAPAPNPAAAATVTAPTTPQQAPQPAPAGAGMPTAADYQRAIYDALNRGDKQKASELAAERDMVAAQQQGEGQQAPQQAAPAQPQQPRAQAAPGPQSMAAPQDQQPQDQATQQQQQVIGTVGQATQQTAQRLDATRQQGERVRLASISPQLPGLQLGGAMPGAQQAQQPPPPPPSPAMAEPSFFSPQPMLPPQSYAPRPATPAQPPPAAAPAAPAGPSGPPPQQPAGVPQQPQPAPYQVAQAQGLPPVVSEPQRGIRPITTEQARAMLNAATTPEQVNAITAMVLKSRESPAASADRFQIIHDANGNWVRLDRLTGQTTPYPGMAGGKGSTKGADTVEIELPDGSKQRRQWNPASGQYDIVVGGPASATAGPPPVRKEVREAERQLYQDFEGHETVKKYRELEQGVQGLKAAFTSGNAAADLVAVIQLFKTIDPGSTVTGAESLSVRNAAGIPETLRAMFNKGVGAGGQFSPELRAEIFNTAQRLQQGKVQQAEQVAKSFRNRAKAYSLDPDRTITFEPFKFEKAKPEDFPDISRREGAPAPGTPRTGPGSSRENPIDVPGLRALEGMPVPTFFRTPDGRIGVWE